jgi:hypothetical protein
VPISSRRTGEPREPFAQLPRHADRHARVARGPGFCSTPTLSALGVWQGSRQESVAAKAQRHVSNQDHVRSLYFDGLRVRAHDEPEAGATVEDVRRCVRICVGLLAYRPRYPFGRMAHAGREGGHVTRVNLEVRPPTQSS